MTDVRSEIEEGSRRYQREGRAIALAGRIVLVNEAIGLWAYVGQKSDYIIIEGLYCSCGKFVRNLSRSPGCPHIAAVAEAKALGKIRRAEGVEPEDVVWDAVSLGFSPRLRRALAKTAGEP